MADQRPNVLFIMTDQQRADTIAALGNPHVYTPNYDRLVQRGVAFTRGYSPCPVCVPARYTIRTGCMPPTTGIYMNGFPDLVDGQPEGMEDRCGPYLARTMRGLGYRTWGIGKFHTLPRFEDLGYDEHLHSEELYSTPEDRERDAYARFIAEEHPEHDYLEGLYGERTEMYYMPQMRQMPQEATQEAWAAREAVKRIHREDGRPWFGFVSIVTPHPPLAPPLPYNRLYNPDQMPPPALGERDVDLMDDYLGWMNYGVYAEEVDSIRARACKARYYGLISWIDTCLGRILDAVDASGEAENTVIVFYSDHGEHLGDHHAWQKESFFDAACRVPFLVSWPRELPQGAVRDDLVSLTDLFGIATTAAGSQDLRDGIDVLGVLRGEAAPREHLFGFHGMPGTRHFKMMVREERWKYIYMANGGREQLFDMEEDPDELTNRAGSETGWLERLRAVAVAACRGTNVDRALEGDVLRSFPFEPFPRQRIVQFDVSRGVTGWPESPGDVIG
jgi:choline-sulfatase